MTERPFPASDFCAKLGRGPCRTRPQDELLEHLRKTQGSARNHARLELRFPPISVIVETTFCDNEHDYAVRRSYLDAYKLTLKSLAGIDIPPNVTVNFITYLSSDKIDELPILEGFIASLECSRQATFTIVPYEHPIGGYGNENATHIDLIKNPNRSAPLRDHLFALALNRIVVDKSRILIRVGIDDDDAWLPWQLHEICRAATAALDLSSDLPAAVGMANHIVVDVNNGLTADVVPLRKVLPGNKFLVAPAGMFERMKTVSPWAIPEDFSLLAAARFDRVAIRLMLTDSNAPGFLYMRRGINLSTSRKDMYYTKPPIRVSVASVEDVLSLPKFLDLATGGDEVHFQELT